MRLMLKFTIPVEKGNQAAKDGTMKRAIDALIEQTRAEAAYFTLEHGERSDMIFFEAADQSQLPGLNEPLFAAIDASIDIVPVLNQDDLRKGLGA